ncbi:MAG: F0F1 ATP synthase subunit epsilon [Chloroflexota bacterium]|nr:F0F1 ATP synthase subunit epsilon [Chloroflexota bacterium]
MAKIAFEIVTAERVVLSDHVDIVIAPGVEGELGILPNHAPLLTMLQPGELTVRTDGQETCMFVRGGFLEVMQDRVTVLADVAERAEDIDLARAEAAKRRAEERLKGRVDVQDLAAAEAALRRALLRIKVAERRKQRHGPPRVQPS